MHKRIAFLFGDIGSARMAVKAILKLQQISSETEIHCFVFGTREKASTTLSNAEIPYEKRAPRTTDGRFDLVVFGAGSKAYEPQLFAFNLAGSLRVPCIGLQDLWGGGMVPEVRAYPPDCMCVIDKTAALIYNRVHHDARVEIVGSVTLSEIAGRIGEPGSSKAGVCIEKVRNEIVRRMRTFHGTHKEILICTFASGGESPEHALEQLRAFALYGTLAKMSTLLDRPVAFVPRSHPSLDEGTMAEFRSIAREILDMKHGVLVVDAPDIDLDKLAVSSDVFVCNWGTTSAYYAAYFGVPVIMTLFPNDQDVRIARGYENGLPPLLAADAGAGATGPVELHYEMQQLLRNEKLRLKKTENARKVFSKLYEPGADLRIAKLLLQELEDIADAS